MLLYFDHNPLYIYIYILYLKRYLYINISFLMCEVATGQEKILYIFFLDVVKNPPCPTNRSIYWITFFSLFHTLRILIFSLFNIFLFLQNAPLSPPLSQRFYFILFYFFQPVTLIGENFLNLACGEEGKNELDASFFSFLFVSIFRRQLYFQFYFFAKIK